MRTGPQWTEQWQHFQTELTEQFWGDLYQRTRLAWPRCLEAASRQGRDRVVGLAAYERAAARQEYRNGFYWRDDVTRFGALRLRIARPRTRACLPPGLARLQRWAPEVTLLIRESFLRGLSTRQVGRVVALLTEEPVSAQTVSALTRDLERLVRQFHQAPLGDRWRYLILDGVSLKVRRPAGRQRLQLLVAYGIDTEGRRQLVAFTRSPGESQAAWEGLLNDLYRRGLEGRQLKLMVTDGCPGLAAALQTVYPRVAHQRCWVHKLRNLLAPVRRRDHAAVRDDPKAIYQAASLSAAQAAARRAQQRWQGTYPQAVRSLRTTHSIERCFVEVRRRTRPMVCFVNVQSVDRILYSIFHRFNLEWAQHTLPAFTQVA